MKKHLLVILIFLFYSNLFCISPVKEGNTYYCKYKGFNRDFILFLPDNFETLDESKKSEIPLILMLHGYGSTVEGFMNQTGFHQEACKRNYAVVYVSGTTKKGDKGSATGWHYFNDKQSKNDVAFLIDVAEYLQKEYGLCKKTFAAGFSNGAFMITKLACQYSDYFTAVASVAGMMPLPVWDKRAKSINTGFLQINGTKDDVVPMRLNDSAKSNPNPAMEDVIQYFEQANGDCGKNKVRWILIEDGRHSWPDKSFSSIDCNTEILDFFDTFRQLNY